MKIEVLQLSDDDYAALIQINGGRTKIMGKTFYSEIVGAGKLIRTTSFFTKVRPTWCLNVVRRESRESHTTVSYEFFGNLKQFYRDMALIKLATR
jgi:hypothetical protein